MQHGMDNICSKMWQVFRTLILITKVGLFSFQIIMIRKSQILLNVGIYCDKKFMHCKTSPKYYMLLEGVSFQDVLTWFHNYHYLAIARGPRMSFILVWFSLFGEAAASAVPWPAPENMCWCWFWKKFYFNIKSSTFETSFSKINSQCFLCAFDQAPLCQ